jgi:predicted O-linked N-acetylglucosamine transferase (SPINDLY family)
MLKVLLSIWKRHTGRCGKDGVRMNIQKILQQALNYYRADNLDKTEETLRDALKFFPDSPEIHFYLGMTLQYKKQYDESISHYKKALQFNPGLAEAYHYSGVIFQEKGQLEEAITNYQKALKLKPGLDDLYYNLGTAFQKEKRFSEAINCYQKAVQRKPAFAEAYFNMANAFSEIAMRDKSLENHQKAIENYDKALSINPKYEDAYLNRGFILQFFNKLEEAFDSYKKILEINPTSAMALNNIGEISRIRGKLNEAEAYFRRAIEIDPDFTSACSNLLITLSYNPCYSGEMLLTEHRIFAEKYFELRAAKSISFSNEQTSERRLRIGYVSPDFRRHSVAYFTEPVILKHNREQFEVFCYSNVKFPDETTFRIRQYTDVWRDISEKSDEDVIKLIRDDCIDILIDLAGHTNNNRILLFAHKCAPVQINWIGYPATTGFQNMDYKIVDHYTDPPGLTEPFYSEKLIRLPDCFLCYLPEKDSPAVGDLPARVSGYITFGSFNNFAKVSPLVIECWTNILKMIPGARLILKAQSFSDMSVRNYVKEIFTHNGISDERIEMLRWKVSKKEHLNLYNRIDVALDTFHYNGTTTTCEALWMGVPVITIAGDTHASRVGVSLLSNVGLPELVVKTPQEYVEITVNLANDIRRLEFLRRNLRDMMLHSPLTDSEHFVVNLEKSYRDIWDNWCAGKAERNA